MLKYLTKNNDLKQVFWKEVQKTNWRNVNNEALKSFLIVIIGDAQSLENLITSLETTTYDFFNVKHKRSIPLSDDARASLIMVPAERQHESRAIIDQADIVIVDQQYAAELKLKLNKTYLYTQATEKTVFEKILTENDHLKQALCYNYPVFRTSVAKSTMGAVSLQNATWAGGSSLPNIIPGMHSLPYAALEATSDFSVLTINELRMTFILASVSGRKVNPVKLIPEIIIMFGGAKGAQMLATQVVSKIPAGAGTIVKTGIAYAFTYAIGEAVYLNMNYGITYDKKTLIRRIEELRGYGEEMTKSIANSLKRINSSKKENEE
jgi:hypothetical protein